jgi:hypothetical protein
MTSPNNIKVGELNPSQLLYSYGVGAIVDLPHISAIVSGLDDWPIDPEFVREIQEERLLYAIKTELGNQGNQVQLLLSLPSVLDEGGKPDPFDKEARIGVPVSTFPQWLVCPSCQILAPTQSELFELKVDYYHPDRTHYEHVNCQRARKPTVLPARFLVCCENGHLDDFPWVEYVHNFDATKFDHKSLTLMEYGPSGEARDLFVTCNICGERRQLAQAFGRENREKMPVCKGRRPHLHDYDPEGCDLNVRAILLGASNIWFPFVLNTISIPVTSDKLDNLVAENWSELSRVEKVDELAYLEKWGKLQAFAEFSLPDLWKAIEKRKAALPVSDNSEHPNLQIPEWTAFTSPGIQKQTPDFRLKSVNPPKSYIDKFSQIVLIERLREVRALVGFTRIDSPGEMGEGDEEEIKAISPISRKNPKWIPAVEVRGEGIFLQFKEEEILKWLAKPLVNNWERMFFKAHKDWRKSRLAENPEANFPGLRYVLLHSFSHVLMRQFAMECGYTQASIRERIYSNNPGQPGVPMAGILLYTSAPDSEGTLGGLVNLGEPQNLERHIDAALEACGLCASDPTCSEHMPGYGASTVHAAACHSCLFSPETSCEKGNRYLDRSVLVSTVSNEDHRFFNHG